LSVEVFRQVSIVDGLNMALTTAQPNRDFLACPNYLDPAPTAAEAANLSYSAANYSKLVQNKRDLDRKAVF
jgi:hypothetical protein